MKKKSAKKTTAPARRRNAAATREAILDSARQAFARAGYDGVGVREIAKGAGVTAMMVNRYFGSKERLFAEAIAKSMATSSVLTPIISGSTATGHDLAVALISITKKDAMPLEGFQIMLRSASSERAAEIGREQIENHHQRLIAAALSGDWAPQRAAVVLSLVAGFQIMRQMIGISPLTEVDPKALVKILGPVFDQLIKGEQ